MQRLLAQMGGGGDPSTSKAMSGLLAEAGNCSEWPLWLARMLKAIKRNRVDDIRTLLKSGAARRGGRKRDAAAAPPCSPRRPVRCCVPDLGGSV